LRIKSETTVGMLVLGGILVFLYMGFKIGAFRFDSAQYDSYLMKFNDISGLTRKAEVKIAGVKVGWVEQINLVPDNSLQACATVTILKQFKLYENAHAVVRQEGLLGLKYLEIIVGDSTHPVIPSGGTIHAPQAEPTSVDELMHKFKHIAANIESITDSFKSTTCGAQGEKNLCEVFDNLQIISHNFARFSDLLNQSFTRNEDNLDSLLQIGEQIRRIADRLDHQILPAVQENIQKTAESIGETSIQVRDGFTNIASISTKIDQGKGLIGKLVNEDETYYDLKVAAQGLKNYFAKIDSLELVFDIHGESMQRPSDGWRHEDSKFFVDMKLFPNEDHFYVIQISSSERGYKDEIQFLRDYATKDQCVVNTDDLFIRDQDRLDFTFDRTDTIWRRNQTRLGFQFGKIFGDIALRIGLFEGFGGVGIDFDIPTQSEKFRWVTSLELYDLTGWNHRSKRYENVIADDRRPHVKWINKMYILRNLYLVFGADDFISKRNANAFFGAGIRFGDEDIKYVLPSFGASSGNGLSNGYS
jgi:phospholipid/cholesterol/gamma-HCH transport system substrate-binding protein